MAKKDGIKKLFDNIAPNYDKLNHILSLNIDKRWRQTAISYIADIPYPLRVLDVACGTGDFTIDIARSMVKESKVIGIDISEKMMEIGRKKIIQSKLNAAMIYGDCEDLPFETSSFERISVGFGVRNFENIDLALNEMFRVLTPKGKIVILELSMPSNAIIRQIYKFYFLKILPFVGGLISKNRGAYEYLPASVLQFPSPEEFVRKMEDAGFSKIQHKSLTFGICRMYIGSKL